MSDEPTISIHKVLDWKTRKVGNKDVRVQNWKILINSVEVFQAIRDVYQDEMNFGKDFDVQYQKFKKALTQVDINLEERTIYI